jgi:fatty acid desaturase
LVWARPLQGAFVFALPMMGTLFFTAWVTYDHHVGLHTDNPFEGSFNIMNQWFNRLTGNLGYHTAHHYRQGVHWSRLPELHDKIKDRIPAHCFTDSLFDAFLPNPVPVSAVVGLSASLRPPEVEGS